MKEVRQKIKKEETLFGIIIRSNEFDGSDIKKKGKGIPLRSEF